jgi:hypothetical protein
MISAPRKPRSSKPEVILELMAEGGSLELVTRKKGKVREFAVRVEDQSPSMIDEGPSLPDCPGPWRGRRSGSSRSNVWIRSPGRR